MMRNLRPEEQLRVGNEPWERKFEGNPQKGIGDKPPPCPPGEVARLGLYPGSLCAPLPERHGSAEADGQENVAPAHR